MLRLLKIVAMVIASAWGVLRVAEEAFAAWVRRSTRPRDLSGLAWA